MTEAQIQDAIRLELGDRRRYPDAVLYRNNNGVRVDADTQRYMRFGLGVGTGDLVGHFRCGDGRWIWVEAEIKTPRGRLDEAQVIRRKFLEELGIEYVVLRSVNDAIQWIESLRRRFA